MGPKLSSDHIWIHGLLPRALKINGPINNYFLPHILPNMTVPGLVVKEPTHCSNAEPPCPYGPPHGSFSPKSSLPPDRLPHHWLVNSPRVPQDSQRDSQRSPLTVRLRANRAHSFSRTERRKAHVNSQRWLLGQRVLAGRQARLGF